MRRTVGGALALLLVAELAAACTRPARTALHIDVSGLPSGTAAQVRVAGPDNYTITATDERDVHPGTFHITVTPVHANQSTFFAVAQTTDVGVAGGQTVTFAAAYQVDVPDATKVVDPASVSDVTPDHVVVPATAQVKPGDHLIAGTGGQVTGILVRKVVSVSTQDGRTVVQTEPARLDEALPAGIIEFGSAEGLPLMLPSAYDLSAIEADLHKKFEFQLYLKKGFCRRGDGRKGDGSAAGSLTYELERVHLPFTGRLSWGVFPPHVDIAVHTGIEVSQSIEAEVSAAISCSITKEIDLTPICHDLVGTLVHIGPITLDCNVKIGAKAKVETKGSWNLGRVTSDPKLAFSAEYNSQHGGFSSDHSFDAGTHVDGPGPPEFKVKVGASLFVEVGLEGKDPSGTLILSANLKLDAGPSIESSADALTATFDVTPTVELEATFDTHLFEDVSKGVEVGLPKWSVDLWRTLRKEGDGGQNDAGPFASNPVPQHLPDDLSLTGTDIGFGPAPVSRDRTARWLLPACPAVTLTSDAHRTEMLSGSGSGADESFREQVAVFPDADTASQVLGELRDRSSRCTGGERSPTRVVRVASDGIRYNVFQTEPGNDLGDLDEVVIVRAGNAIILADLFSAPATAEQLDEPADGVVAAVADVADQLCTAGFDCA
jgi:hypothetical protein